MLKNFLKFASRNKEVIILVFLVLAILFYKINKPFIGHHDWNSAVYSTQAREFLQKGIWPVHHYPPLLPLLLSASFFIFGIKEWAARLVPVIFSCGMIIYLYLFVDKLKGKRVAFLSCLFLIITPIFIYFGKMPVHEIITPFFIIFTLYYYLLWFKERSGKYYFLVILGTVLGELSGWVGYYLTPLLIIHFWFFKKRKREFWRIIWLFPLSCFMFVLYLTYSWLVSGRFDTSLFETFLFRLNIGKQAEMYGVTFEKFIILQARWLVVYFTRIIVVLAFLNIVWLVIKTIKNKKMNFKDSFVFILLIFGFTHSLIFRNAAFIHDYLLYYTLPFFSFSAALGVNFFYEKIHTWNRKSASVFLVAVFFLVVTERREFVKALLSSEMNLPGVRLGRLINQYTKKQESILVTSREFGSFFDVFVNFYADGKVFYTDTPEKESLSSYRFLIIPKSHDYLSEDFKKELFGSFQSFEEQGFVFFDLYKYKKTPCHSCERPFRRVESRNLYQ